MLHAKEKAISLFKTKESLVSQPMLIPKGVREIPEIQIKIKDQAEIETNEDKINVSNSRFDIETPDENSASLNKTTQHDHEQIEHDTKNITKNESNSTTENSMENSNDLKVRRRFPVGLRRKLRMRPLTNGTFKGQLSRDMMALNAKRYQIRRNATKSQEWKTLLPLMIKTNKEKESQNNTINVTEQSVPITISEEPTTIIDYNTESTVIVTSQEVPSSSIKNLNNTETLNTESINTIPTTTIESTATIVQNTVTETPAFTPIIKQLNSSSIRRQAFNNRLKKKRLKQKNSTTESPQDDMMKSLFGLGNLVSSSEFIAKTTVKKENYPGDDNKDFTGLEDFMTTAMSRNIESSTKGLKSTSVRSSTTQKAPTTWSTTEETAKFEIEEILNDTRSKYWIFHSFVKLFIYNTKILRT